MNDCTKLQMIKTKKKITIHQISNVYVHVQVETWPPLAIGKIPRASKL